MGGAPMKHRKFFSLAVYILLALGLVLSLIAPRIPSLIEAGYSQSLYPRMIRPISLFTGLFPFSLAEFILIASVCICLVMLILALRTLVKKPKAFFHGCLRIVPKIALLFVLLYVGFNMVWGLNYSRLSFATLSGLQVEPAAVEDLKELALSLTRRANELRGLVHEDASGVMVLPQGIREMLGRAELGYQRAARIYPELGGKYGRPKGVFLSRYWSFTGISGAYFPFTAEANVNVDQPHFLLPSTAAHEMAHQRGFAREDEANFIAYLTCSAHPDPDFQYSGVALALGNTMNALYRYDREAYKEVRSQYSEGLNRDLQNLREYWARFEGPVERVSNRVNDTYLKANRQQDGVHSYGRMVDLLLAEFRRR